MKNRLFSLGTLFALAVFMAGVLVSRAVAGGNPIQIHLDHWANGRTPTDTNKKWVDGNLHRTNSRYGEDDSVPTRFAMENLPAGSTHKLTFQYLTSKNQGYVKHAHDFLTKWDQPDLPNNSGTPDPCNPLVQGSGTSNICTGSPTVFNTPRTDFVAIPADGNLNGTNGWSGTLDSPREFSLWNATFTAPKATFNGIVFPSTSPQTTSYAGTTLTEYSVTFTVTGAVGSGLKTVVLALGAHLAKDQEWSGPTDNGACDINGAPYHWRYDLVDASGNREAGGSRDRSIMCTVTGNSGTITVKKVCLLGDVPITDASTEFDFTAIEPNLVDLFNDEFSVACGTGDAFVSTPAGTNGVFKITELVGTVFEADNTPDPSFGWELRNIICSKTNGSTFLFKGGADSGDNTIFEANDRTAEINYSSGDNVTCTFTNALAKMPLLHKRINGDLATCSDNQATTTVTETDDITGVRPCTYPNGPTLPSSATDTRFTFNLYFTDSGGLINGRPGPPTVFPFLALASAVIPPKFDAPGLIGVPLTICEEPSSPYGLFSVKVDVTDGKGTTDTSDDTTSTIFPTVYGLVNSSSVDGVVLNPFGPHTFPAGTYSCFNINIPQNTTHFEFDMDNRPAKLEVKKKLVPSNDPGKFNLQIDGSTAGTGGNVGDGGTTGTITVSAVIGGISHSVGETAGTGTVLSDYVSSTACVNNNNGANFPITSGSVTLNPGDDVTCTITNNRKPTITLTKSCVPFADTSSTFTLQIGTSTKSAKCGESLGPLTVDFASVTVSESSSSLSIWNKTILCSPVSAGSPTTTATSISWPVNLTDAAPGTVETCTITNVQNTCSYTQGAWFAPPNGTNPATILRTFFPSVYSSGLVVGDNGGPWTLKFGSSAAVVATEPGGTSAVLTASQVDPCGIVDNPGSCHLSTGNLGSQVTALKINVDLGVAGAFLPNFGGIGAYTLTGTGTSLDGQTVSAVLAAANTALGGGALPSGFTPDTLAGFLGLNLNPSFDNCIATDWATTHLR